MKKLITTIGIATTALASLATPAFALNVVIPTPSIGAGGNANDIGKVIGNMITIVIVIAVIAVLFMLVFGAFEWITSGGDKDAVSKARGRIVNALIGLVIIALAFLLVSVAGSILGFSLTEFQLPRLTQ